MSSSFSPIPTVPQRPPVDSIVAHQCFDRMYFESDLYDLPDFSVRTSYWANSTSVPGVRSLRIGFYQQGDYQQHPVDPQLRELWLAEMHSIVAEYGLQDNVKFYTYYGVQYVKIWYKSDHKRYDFLPFYTKNCRPEVLQHRVWYHTWFERIVNGQPNPWEFDVSKGWVEGKFVLKPGSDWETEWAPLSDPRQDWRTLPN